MRWWGQTWKSNSCTLFLVGPELLHHRYSLAPGELGHPGCVYIITDTRVDYIRHASVGSPKFSVNLGRYMLQL